MDEQLSRIVYIALFHINRIYAVITEMEFSGVKWLATPMNDSNAYS